MKWWEGWMDRWSGGEDGWMEWREDMENDLKMQFCWYSACDRCSGEH